MEGNPDTVALIRRTVMSCNLTPSTLRSRRLLSSSRAAPASWDFAASGIMLHAVYHSAAWKLRGARSLDC